MLPEQGMKQVVSPEDAYIAWLTATSAQLLGARADLGTNQANLVSAMVENHWGFLVDELVRQGKIPPSGDTTCFQRLQGLYQNEKGRALIESILHNGEVFPGVRAIDTRKWKSWLTPLQKKSFKASSKYSSAVDNWFKGSLPTADSKRIALCAVVGDVFSDHVSAPPGVGRWDDFESLLLVLEGIKKKFHKDDPVLHTIQGTCDPTEVVVGQGCDDRFREYLERSCDRLLDQVFEELPRYTTVTGEGRSGKTRSVAEAVKRFSIFAHVLWVTPNSDYVEIRSTLSAMRGGGGYLPEVPLVLVFDNLDEHLTCAKVQKASEQLNALLHLLGWERNAQGSGENDVVDVLAARNVCTIGVMNSSVVQQYVSDSVCGSPPGSALRLAARHVAKLLEHMVEVPVELSDNELADARRLVARAEGNVVDDAELVRWGEFCCSVPNAVVECAASRHGKLGKAFWLACVDLGWCFPQGAQRRLFVEHTRAVFIALSGLVGNWSTELFDELWESATQNFAGHGDAVGGATADVGIRLVNRPDGWCVAPRYLSQVWQPVVLPQALSLVVAADQAARAAWAKGRYDAAAVLWRRGSELGDPVGVFAADVAGKVSARGDLTTMRWPVELPPNPAYVVRAAQDCCDAEPERAVTLLEDAARWGHPVALVNLGVHRLTAGDVDGACVLWQEAASVGNLQAGVRLAWLRDSS